MKASELIDQLKNLMEYLGDHEILVKHMLPSFDHEIHSTVERVFLTEFPTLPDLKVRKVYSLELK